MKTNILNMNQDNYNNGKISGEYFKTIIQKNIQNYSKVLNDSKNSTQIMYILEKLRKTYPQYYEEIKGKADGAQVDFNTYFVLMCPEVLKMNSHCTTMQSNYSKN